MRIRLKRTLLLIAVLVICASPSLANDLCESAYSQALATYKNNNDLQQSDFTKWQNEQIQLSAFINNKLKSCPNEPRLYALLSVIYISSGQNKKALETARKSVELGPDSWQSNHSLSMALDLTGQSGESITYLKKAILLAPAENKQHLLANLCSVQESSKQYEQAIESCSSLIKISNQHRAFGYYTRGRSMAALGKKVEANKDFSNAKKLGFGGQWFYSDEHIKDGKAAPNQAMKADEK